MVTLKDQWNGMASLNEYSRNNLKEDINNKLKKDPDG